MSKAVKPRATRGRGASTHEMRRGYVAEVCRRIADGERLVDILRAPGMPMSAKFHAWVERSPELSSMYVAAKETRRLKPVRPNMAATPLYCPLLGREFCARLALAERLDDVTSQEGMPCETTVYRWLKEAPEFAADYRAAQEVQARRRFEMAWEVACHARWDGWRGAKLFIDTIRWQIPLLAPETYGPPVPGGLEKHRIEVEVVKFGSDDPPYHHVMTVGEFRELSSRQGSPGPAQCDGRG